jgi:DNA-binding transcriptional regulator YhcF (GntR family)
MEKLNESPAFKAYQNLDMEGFDPVSAGGFTQVPNILLNSLDLSANAKLAYAKLLSYAWHHDFVFPGQERMAKEVGASRSVVNRAILELEKAGWLEIRRRGQGKTNLYVLKHRVRGRRG